MHGFPWAGIHELLAPDLLHQLIKGMFKDHLVTWVVDYLHTTHGETAAFEIIEDIDHQYVVLRRDFSSSSQKAVQHLSHSSISWASTISWWSRLQPVDRWWLKGINEGMSDPLVFDSETHSHSQVFLTAIAGYVPSAIVQSIAVFMDACYIACHNAITAPALKHFCECAQKFHKLWNIFIEAGAQDAISLPRQHALNHFYHAIHLFGSPNGLCSSITESKHIKAVKEPWHWPSQHQALIQMLQIIVQMDKMTVLHWIFSDHGMLVGMTSSYTASIRVQEGALNPNEEDEENDSGPVPGDLTSALFVVNLATKFHASNTNITASKLTC